MISRFDYTCMGDTVNLAARLEGANKAFGSKILMGPQTYDEAKDDILAKPLADLVVVGKTEAVSVYELYAMKDDASDQERAHVDAWVRAHEALRAGEVETARDALDEAGETNPGDGPRGLAPGDRRRHGGGGGRYAVGWSSGDVPEIGAPDFRLWILAPAPGPRVCPQAARGAGFRAMRAYAGLSGRRVGSIPSGRRGR